MDLPISQSLVYAALGSVLIALFVGFATNKWSLRVLLLLALRLAIGWHFLFEGLHKIHSHAVGETTTSRPFTSEPYFAAAEGPMGEYMRKKYLGDVEAQIADRVAPKEGITQKEFAKLTPPEKARYCPEPVAKELDAAIGEAEKAAAAKTSYARWVYGEDARDAKVKFVSGDVPLTVPSRLAIIAVQKKLVDELTARDAAGLGNGYGIDQKRLREAKTDLRTSQAELAADGEKFVASLKTAAGAEAKSGSEPKAIETMDKITMWAITIIGVCLIFGIATPVACLAGAAFLAMTYLTHPPFPWYPLPPNTEGNPLFVNKNVIELIALLVIAVHPTGRWLGLDALFVYLCCGRKASNTQKARG